MKITVKAFHAEKGVQANSKAWHNAMQSEHVQRMATSYFLEKTDRRGAEQEDLETEPLLKRAKQHVDGELYDENLKL